jgi:GTP-binding protein LepA
MGPAMNIENIRNFCIIAHIDHGKSTLADRFLEVTKTVDKRDLKEQTLDTMDLERERGITIKLQPAKMDYKGYTLNLIDTPGHVDFAYEVSRSLAAVEGALLVVDASQGIEAQTLSTLYAAIDAGLEIIPVVNKIDLPHAEPEKVAEEIINLLGCPHEDIIFASGKTGQGVEDVLDRIIERVPEPRILDDKGPKALIFDSFYDSYKGVITYVRMFNGGLKKGEKITLMAEKTPAEVLEIGYLKPKFVQTDGLGVGEIGYVVTGLKEVKKARVGDTITSSAQMAKEALAGYQRVKPFVFAGLFTTEGDDFPLLREALGKLSLSDSSLEYEPENSAALGFGFRCGFLGLLHMEIVKERLEREFNLDLIATSPSVSYEIVKTNGETVTITSPADLPEITNIKEIREPFVKLEVVTPSDYIGPIMDLVQKRHGIYKNTSYLDANRAVLEYKVPLSGIVTDFFDQLKSISSGYASLNYDFLGYRPENLVKVDVLINGQAFDTLALIVHKSEAQRSGEEFTKKLKDLIPRQNFKIPIQAAIGGKIIAREDIPAFRKDVTAKLYGGDVTRKRKLLEKQKKGKKRMKMVGNVEIPSDTFIKLLKS